MTAVLEGKVRVDGSEIALCSVEPKFVVKTVKWDWAENVQKKDAYRDDEFVETSTKEEALEAIDFLLSRPNGLTYTITVKRDGKYFTYFRHNMPCLGGLVKYRDSHGDRYFMNPYFPRDIYVSFPEGDVVYIGCYRPYTKDIFTKPFYQFLFSSESPWVAAFGTKETIIFKDSYFVLTNMDSDPTVFYSLMRLGGFAVGGVYASSRADWNPKAEILISKTLYADPRRLAGQKPIKISGGTWAEGFGYTRPYNESIFKTKLPHKLEEFGAVGSYPEAPYNNSYFISEMRDRFGVDVVKGPKDAKLHDALVESWNYFKEKSSELGE